MMKNKINFYLQFFLIFFTHLSVFIKVVKKNRETVQNSFQAICRFFYRKFKIVIEEGKTQEIRWPHVLIFCKGKTLQVEINISDFSIFFDFSDFFRFLKFNFFLTFSDFY